MNELSTLRNLSYQKSLLSSSIYPADKNTIQNLIVSRLPIHDKPLGKAAAHHFSKPGKILRAKMAMHGAEALQVNQTAAIRWAAAVGSPINTRVCTESTRLLRAPRISVASLRAPPVRRMPLQLHTSTRSQRKQGQCGRTRQAPSQLT